MQRLLTTLPIRVTQIVDLDASNRVEGMMYGPRLLAESPSLWRRLMRREPHYRSFGTLQFLLSEARERFETRPLSAREITSAVLDFVDEAMAPSTVHKTALRGLAWKEHASALQYAGDLHEALRAAERSVNVYGESSLLTFAQTRAKLIACDIRRDLGDSERALLIARECATIFQDYASTAERALARLCEGNVLCSLKRFPEALAIFREVVAEAERADDRLTLARALQSTAECACEMGDIEGARDLYPCALAMFNELELVTEAARARWGYGRCLAAQGKASFAASELYHVRAVFLGLGMKTDAAMVGLDVVRTRFDAGEGVRALCAELVTTFTEAGLAHHAIDALAYLREQARRDAVTAAKIERVRTYFGELARKPSLLFAKRRDEENVR
jgi:tetratricopeptide (TPR) repeat protein